MMHNVQRKRCNNMMDVAAVLDSQSLYVRSDGALMQVDKPQPYI